MWKQIWQKWTIDKPAAFGDWLWQMLVVELAASLNRLTLRQVIAFIPVVILVVAYTHSIPLPPELMLVGDVLAYIDIFSIILLLSLIGRAATIFIRGPTGSRASARACSPRPHGIASSGCAPTAGAWREEAETVDRPSQEGRRPCAHLRHGLGVTA
jgi:hypothetical protein